MMKKLLILALGFGVSYQVTAQSLKPIKQNWQDGQVNLTAQPKGPKRVTANRSAAINLNPIQLSTAVNAFTQVGTSRVRLSANSALNAVAFIHRGGGIASTSGDKNYFDISTDGGATWSINTQLMDTYGGGLGHRYPQGSIVNLTAGNTDVANARLVGMAPAALGVNNGWGGVSEGSMKFDGTGFHLQKFQDGNAFIPQCMIAGAPGTIWTSNDTTTDGFVHIWKGTYDATNDTMVWSVNFIIDAEAIMDKAVDSATHYYNVWIGFDPTGMNGWIGVAGDLASDGTDSLTYPIFWKTTNGGTSWSGPTGVKLSTLPMAADSIMFGLPPTTAFDDGMAVDANGNPHFFLGATPFTTAYSVANTTSGLYDITTTDGGATWTSILIDTIFGLRGSSFGTLTHDNEQKASVSPDGTKVFFSWVATPIANQDPADPQPNDFPDLFLRGLDVNTGAMTPVYNVTGGSNFDGGAFLPTVALHTTKSGSVHSFHSVIVEPTGDENVTINFYYLDGVDIDDADFVTGIAKTEKNTLFSVSANYPNPFTKTTTFDMNLTKASNVEVKVSNILGQVVSTQSESRAAGNHKIQINAESLSSGIYFYTVTAGGYQVTNKMIVK